MHEEPVFAKSRISSNDWLKSSPLAHVFGRFLDPLLKSSSLKLKKRLKIAEVPLTTRANSHQKQFDQNQKKVRLSTHLSRFTLGT